MTEYQQQRLACVHCGITTCRTLPPGVPSPGYGPRFTSIVALCSGAYRMSKRMKQGPFVRCHGPWDLREQLILGLVREGRVQKDDVTAAAPALFE